MDLTGAKRGVLAVKGKYGQVVSAVEKALSGRSEASRQRLEVARLPNTYPTGDEFVLVQEVLGRTIPELGLPLHVGVVVSNVASLRAVARALHHGEPLTRRLVTVLGEVARPVTLEVPLGTPLSALIEAAGGTRLDHPHFIVGGPMMGSHTEDPSVSVQKTTSGLFVLREDHPVVRRRLIEFTARLRMAQAACCLCNECTQVCPRNTLGHRIYPDRLMRSMAAGVSHDLQSYVGAFYCCECGLCTVYGCPMYLDPCGMNIEIKTRLREAGVEPPSNETSTPSPFFASKQVPTNRLISRLGLTAFETQTPLENLSQLPARLTLSFKQGVGAPSRPLVKKGQRVARGERLAEPGGFVSAALHASADAVVEAVDDEKVILKTSGGPA